LYKKLLHKSEFGQAHYEEWFKRSPTKLFCNFCTLLQVSTNFGSLKQFLKFKTIENDLKSPHSVGPKSAHGYSAWPSGLPCAVGRKAGWATARRPGPAVDAAQALRAGCAH
jgi:hypothetical protein